MKDLERLIQKVGRLKFPLHVKHVTAGIHTYIYNEFMLTAKSVLLPRPDP